ncbi:MAG: hypothetical protein NC416_06490 [Eubacterium sp.]|nr:hypothetical protein [Eubacterium sp.]
MKRDQQKYIMEDYGRKSVFASFLPGIAGIHGIPIWCYYVNRGQGVVSFGVDNKDCAIMEFYPAHVAYQNVKRTGFRTFLRKDGRYLECFSDEQFGQEMEIGMNSLSLFEKNENEKLSTKVDYFTLPGEKVGALVRKVTVTNEDDKDISLEVLDGMPALIPYGVDTDSMKNMTQTAKAWMQVEDIEGNVPFFRVRASLDDTAAVRAIEAGHFSFGCLEDGTLLRPVVDPEAVFAYDCSLQTAVRFANDGISGVYEQKQITTNILPCSFYGVQRTLASGESLVLYEMIGQVEKKAVLARFMEERKDSAYFEEKREEAESLVDELCHGIATKTASESFDIYCQYTYMDNILRGGYPIPLGNNKLYYVYSRKHGDLERDYNYFSMLPEFFSQGNGNFRDVNQNRRCDTFFAPFVGRENIKEFYSLIQLDGYNPLGVEKLTYRLDKEKARALFGEMEEEAAEKLMEFVDVPFTPGALWAKLDDVLGEWKESLFYQIIDFADSMVNGKFGEGYWSDHWTYNLDLIEDYLEINPEKERDMLYEEEYTYFLSQININHRTKRYEETVNGLRQYHALDEESRRDTEEKLVRAQFGKGEVVYVTLMEKLLLLCATKFAALDAYGMGVEMEGGKPGWYDALNGLPGLFGSSMAETYELARMFDYVISVLEKYSEEVALTEELGNFIDELQLVVRLEQDHLAGDGEVLSFWNRVNDVKELYRDRTFEGISGKKKSYQSKELAAVLKEWKAVVGHGIKKACAYGDGICPTYFSYEVPEYEKKEDGIHPLRFEVKRIPAFLEGPVRYLKLDLPKETKKKLYESVKNGELYDKKLSMYKVNASLENASYELGRARAFTPGWLENESIWLHMEYKYLLELLRSGMYEEFFDDFHKAAVPFLTPEVYGRSIYENSSFIVSSRNPNEKIHGKGFVARLSGSTIEFISMWKLMMFGRNVFTLRNGELTFAPSPAIPEYLIPEEKTVEAVLLGEIAVEYRMKEKKDHIPGEYVVESMHFLYKNRSEVDVNAGYISGKLAEDIRARRVERIEIRLS